MHNCTLLQPSQCSAARNERLQRAVFRSANERLIFKCATKVESLFDGIWVILRLGLGLPFMVMLRVKLGVCFWNSKQVVCRLETRLPLMDLWNRAHQIEETEFRIGWSWLKIRSYNLGLGNSLRAGHSLGLGHSNCLRSGSSFGSGHSLACIGFRFGL